jgi:hypothetical protein
MAPLWIEADTVAIRRALRLVDASARGIRGADAALTQLEDRLGLTPKARRYLQWEARPISTPAPVMALAPRIPCDLRQGSGPPVAERPSHVLPGFKRSDSAGARSVAVVRATSTTRTA